MIGIVFIMFYPCDGRQRASSDMLFKTQSASVYGIDAYLVEVEVDVGSARMQDSTWWDAGQRGQGEPRANQKRVEKLRIRVSSRAGSDD